MTTRLQSERCFHDQQARHRARAWSTNLDRLRFHDDEYLHHETWIAPALAQLGDIAGQPVLDYGCGHGMAAVVLARRGARVIGFDLSAEYLREAQARAQANGVEISLVAADGERLPFADGSFTAIWGNAVLHHVDLRVAGAEILRVLRPGGVAVFCEPWGENPLLNWARRRLPYPGKKRTPDETPLRHRDVDVLRDIFSTVQVQGFQLLSMLRRVLRRPAVTRLLECGDNALLSRCRNLQHWCRYVVITQRP